MRAFEKTALLILGISALCDARTLMPSGADGVDEPTVKEWLTEIKDHVSYIPEIGTCNAALFKCYEGINTASDHKEGLEDACKKPFYDCIVKSGNLTEEKKAMLNEWLFPPTEVNTITVFGMMNNGSVLYNWYQRAKDSIGNVNKTDPCVTESFNCFERIPLPAGKTLKELENITRDENNACKETLDACVVRSIPFFTKAKKREFHEILFSTAEAVAAMKISLVTYLLKEWELKV